MKLRYSILFVFVLSILSFQNTIIAQRTKTSRIKQIYSLSLEELINVKISTAGKIQQRLSDVPASSIIITREEIKKHGYMTIEEVLQNIPGFYGINDYGEGGMLLGVRGFWSGIPNDNIIILLNNIPQTKNVFSNHPLDEIQVPVESIDRIEVVRGPMSVIYGSGAFFGAVNIITNGMKTGNDKNILSIGIGSSNTKKAFLKMFKKIDNLKLSLNVSIYNTDGIDQPAAKLMSNPEILENFGLSSDYSTGKTLAKNYNFLNLSVELDEFYFHLVLIESLSKNHFSFPPFGDGHKTDYSDFNLTIGYHKVFSPRFTLDGKITYFKDHVWFKYNFFHKDFFGIQQIESKAVDFTIDAFYKVNSTFNLQAGFFYKSIFDVYNLYHLPSFNDPFFENNYIDTGDDSIQSLAFYTQFTCKPLKNLQFIAGLRLEKSSPYEIHGSYSNETDIFSNKYKLVIREKVEIIPRIAAIYKLNKNNILKLLYGKAINRPSFFQDATQIPTGAATLIPERIETLELNYQTIFNSDYSIRLNLFHNTLDNLITRIIILDDIGNYDYSYFTNAGRMITNGIEATFNLKPVEALFIEFSGTYQKTEDKQIGHENIEVAYSPMYLAYFKCRYNLTKDFSISLNSQYVGGMESFWDDLPDDSKSYYSPIGRIGTRVGSYFLLGLNIRIENFLKKRFFINIRISNLLDSEIRYPTFTNNPYADKGTLGYGRSFLITAGWKF